MSMTFFCGHQWQRALTVGETLASSASFRSSRPSVALYNGVLKACASSEKWELVIELLKAAQHKTSLDMLSFGTAASGLAKGTRWQQLLALWEDLSFQEERSNALLLKALQLACEEGHNPPKGLPKKDSRVPSADLRRSLRALPVPSAARDVLYAVGQLSDDAAAKLVIADVLPVLELREGLQALSLASPLKGVGGREK
eukprot:symbB.v1.2.008302.t1/scaffold499.1/size195312/8